MRALETQEFVIVGKSAGVNEGAIMGFCNSVPYVQRQMDLLLKEFVDFCRAYLDDIVVASDTFKSHIEHLSLVLQVLERHSVSLEPKKAYIAFLTPTP